MSELEASKYQHGEMKLAFYAQTPNDWHRLAQWVADHRLASDNVRWIIEIPRLLSVFDLAFTLMCLYAVLFCSLAVLDPRVGHTMDVFSPFALSSVILIDSSMESAVHVLMLSIQAVRGLPRLRAPGIVPCIISFFGQLPCFLMV